MCLSYEDLLWQKHLWCYRFVITSYTKEFRIHILVKLKSIREFHQRKKLSFELKIEMQIDHFKCLHLNETLDHCIIRFNFFKCSYILIDGFHWFLKECQDFNEALAWCLFLNMIFQFLSLLLWPFVQILFGCAAQYAIMPASAFAISKILGLSPSLSVGLILLGCCPGGTASNVVWLPLFPLHCSFSQLIYWNLYAKLFYRVIYALIRKMCFNYFLMIILFRF